MFNVVLILKKGGDFHMMDALLLSRHLTRYSNVSVYCITDLVDREYKLNDCILLPMKNPWKGWWSKMNLFSPELEYLRPFLFMDLDTAVLHDIQNVINKIPQNEFITLEDFYRKGCLASGVMHVPANNDKISLIWNKWMLVSRGGYDHLRGDGQFINTITQADNYLQNLTSEITTFKPRGKGWLYDASNKTIVCFHGYPRIPEASKKVKWVNDYVNYGK